MMISDLEKTKRDLADANEFIDKLMAEKHAQTTVPAEPIFDLEALTKGEPSSSSTKLKSSMSQTACASPARH